MKQLDYKIAISNNIVVKTSLELIIDKMNKQDKPNELLLSQFKDSLSRLNDSYLWYNQTKELSLVTSKRNRDLESLLISQKVYIMDLEKEVKELREQNNKLKENIGL